MGEPEAAKPTMLLSKCSAHAPEQQRLAQPRAVPALQPPVS